ncbi:MAG: hypothetical protein RMX68_033540 [Aulosira sp. ZfuVER01]|nr:hypothetical protein [Aulosira sp. ZfuVER01]MDZ7999790.1 hypothetical protein [Aulosira sp. DedVER01a]MDZ8049842.1 hypothetical protein [Aulosira sp. ZfuCHP01]
MKKLTPEQEALMPIIRDEWLKIALDTSPTDKQQAEAAICLAYECVGIKPPQQILWFDNPPQAATWIVNNLDELGLPIDIDRLISTLMIDDEDLMNFLGEDTWDYILSLFEFLSSNNVWNVINASIHDMICRIWNNNKNPILQWNDIYQVYSTVVNLKCNYWLPKCAFFEAIGLEE